MQDAWLFPACPNSHLLQRRKKQIGVFFLLFLIKSNVMTVLLPEACYKEQKSDLIVLITFCCLVAILGFFFPVTKGMRKLDLFCFSTPICCKMLIFLDSRCLESCQMGEENWHRFSIVITRVLCIYRSITYPHLCNSLSDSWKVSKLHENTSFRFCHYRYLERPNPENRAEVYTKRMSQMGGLYMMADPTKHSDCTAKAEWITEVVFP